MPIVKIQKTKNYTYVFWEIKESLKELMTQLKVEEKELIEVNKIRHIKRKKQNITARLILNYLAMKKVKLSYLKTGKPWCENFKHISISHSHNYCVVAISENYVGIDIQYTKNNIKILQEKFINKKEKKYLKIGNNNLKLHFIWSAKEAIYKTLDSLCSLKENIHITKLSNMGTGYHEKNNQKTEYNIHWEMFDDYFLAIATKTL